MPFIDELENGKIYKLINVGYPEGVLELDDTTNRASIHYFVGNPSQQWQAIASNGFWKLKNVGTGLYLGKRLGGRTNETDPVIGTKDEFKWNVQKMKIRRDCDQSEVREFCFHVPYTNILLDTDWYGPFPETRVKFDEKQDLKDDWYNQYWRLDSDVRPMVPLEAGYAYKVVHSSSGTVAHLESTGMISGHEYNQGPNQLWEAIPGQSSPFLWSFKSISNGRYMGIGESENALAELGTRVEAVEDPFIWHVACAGSNGFRLFVPYTEMNIDLDSSSSTPGTKIHLFQQSEQYWIFEKDSDLLFRERSVNPGPPEL